MLFRSRLGCSDTHVIKLCEEAQVLRFVRDGRGRRRIDPQSVMAAEVLVRNRASAGRSGAVYSASEGETAATVFEQINAGKNAIEIVTALRLPPQVVAALFEQYKQLNVLRPPARFLTDEDVMKQLKRLLPWWKDDTDTSLLEAVMQYGRQQYGRGLNNAKDVYVDVRTVQLYGDETVIWLFCNGRLVVGGMDPSTGSRLTDEELTEVLKQVGERVGDPDGAE